MTLLADASGSTLLDEVERRQRAVKAPGTVLDGYWWAQSWSNYLYAVLHPHDGSVRNVIKNAMTERIPAEGGFLVPEILRQEVMSYMTAAIVRPRARVLRMSTERLPIPFLDNSTQGSAAQALGGMTFSLVQEGVAFPSSSPNFGRLVLEAWKAGGYLASVPNELVDDGAGAFGDFLARVIGEGYAWFEDDLFIGGSAEGGTSGGTGVGMPQGLVNAPGAKVITRTGSGPPAIVYADVLAMFKALHPHSRQMGLSPATTSVVWLLSASAMDTILELYYNPTGTEVVPAAGTGWFTAGDGQTAGPALFGIPALVTDHQPAAGTQGDVILVDLGLYLIGDRQVMTIEKSADGAGFVLDATNIRVKSRVDGRYWYQSNITTETTQVVSPLVVLK